MICHAMAVTRYITLVFVLVPNPALLVQAQEISDSDSSSDGLQKDAADGLLEDQNKSKFQLSRPLQQTQSLLELQRSGKQASPNRQYISAAEMAEIYQRYIESFSHQIPEFFIQPDFSAQ